MGLINLKEGRLKTSAKQSTKSVFLVFCGDKANDKRVKFQGLGKKDGSCEELVCSDSPWWGQKKIINIYRLNILKFGRGKGWNPVEAQTRYSLSQVFEAARKTPGGFPGTRQKWVFPKENKEQIKVNGLAQQKQPCREMGAELQGEADAGASSGINIKKVPVAKDIP